MAWMYNLGSVFQKIIDGFYDISFAQHHSIIKRHKFVFHIYPEPRHQLNTIFKKKVKKFLWYVSFVSEQLAIQTFGKNLENLCVFVTDICSSKNESYDFPSVITCQMKLESVSPAHCSFPICCNAFEHLVGIASKIVAYRNHCWVNKCNTCTSSKCTQIKKEHKRKKHFTFKFNKTVVRDSVREVRLKSPLDEE